MWRPEDEVLLERLEDEAILERLFQHHVGPLAKGNLPHPRAAGLIGMIRALDGGPAVVAAAAGGDVPMLARFVEAVPMKSRPPEMLHHVALYYERVASVLEKTEAVPAANAWMRSLAAWLALGEERAYLSRLEEAIVGTDPARPANAPERAVLIPPERVPLQLVGELGRRAEVSARDLAAPGRAALLALAWVQDAARIAGASVETSRRAQAAAERHRNAALDAALSVVGEALDDANARGDLMKIGRDLLIRALQVWGWSGQDEAVEQFVIDRLATIGWELYRAREWAAIRTMFEPFRPLIESMSRRVETDPSRIAFAAPCAQMYVFLTDVERSATRKKELAERAVNLCPTHRNGRLNLAALLCDDAITAMRNLPLWNRQDEVARIAALIARAEKLYPTSSDLPEAKAMFERVRRHPRVMP